MTEASFRIIAAMAIVLAGALAGVNTFDGEWAWDDASSVLLHQHVQSPAKFFQLFQEDQHAFGKGAGNFYRPLLSVTFMADFLLSYDAERDAGAGAYPDIRPLIFHLSNLAWHIAAALLFFVLLSAFEAPRFVRAAAPLLFVLHPLHTEAVAYISGRADMMSAAFIFAGLYFALWQAPPAKRAAGIALSAVCFCAGLLSKESTLIFPVLLGIVILMRPIAGEEGLPAMARRSLPLAVAVLLTAGYLYLRSTVLQFAEAAPGAAKPLGTRLVEMSQAFALYIKLLFLPTGLHMERSLAGAPPWLAVAGILLLAACLALLIAAWRIGQWRIALGLAWFLAAWIPISGLFPLNAPMAEHWLYVPMAGFWWAILEGAWRITSRPAAKRILVGATYALGILFLALTVARNQDWHSNESLFRATLLQNPNTSRVHFNLAVSYGDLLGNNAGAERHYRAALQQYQQSASGASISIEEADIRFSLGKLMQEQGDYLGAIEQYAPLLRPIAGQVELQAAAAVGMGTSMLALGEFAQASNLLSRAASLDPRFAPEAQRMLAGAPF